MELKDTLRAISNDARGWLKAWTRDFTEAEASQPSGDSRVPNPLAWQLGHLACTEEDVAGLFTVGMPSEPLVPASLRAACATGSPVPTAETRYLPLDALWALLDRTHGRLLGVLEAASAADLDRPPRVANPYFHSLGQGVYEAALHENYHVGEIAALRKVLGKPRIG
ncbi:MAG: DinB family protein [Actinomycetota bacterium]|nr:DinB family protein [Actinomycetota bacterium]